MYKHDRACRNVSGKNTSNYLYTNMIIFLNDKTSCTWTNNMILVCSNLMYTKLGQLWTKVLPIMVVVIMHKKQQHNVV